jgi:thiamine biosynthesis lipoprotein
VTSGLVNLGGNVAAIGAKADGSPWKVGIQKPFDTGIIDKKEVTGQSVVTSGVYERCFEKDGTLYHHILDPATGYPVSNGLWGVTIISDSSLQGDALSTVCLLIGQEEAMDLIRQTDGVQAVFVDDRLQVTECE